MEITTTQEEEKNGKTDLRIFTGKWVVKTTCPFATYLRVFPSIFGFSDLSVFQGIDFNP